MKHGKHIMLKTLDILNYKVNRIKVWKSRCVFMFFPRLKDLRNDRDLLQTDIAKLLNISQTVYSRYERGFQTVPVEYLMALADFYHTSTDHILGRTNKPAPSQK